VSQYLRIIKWAQMQHYKDRAPPWIKLHRDLLTSETWVSSSNDDRVLAIAIMMLAADTDNRIPANARYIQRRAYLDSIPDWTNLVSLNFIEIVEESDDASAPLASARPETEGETEKITVPNGTGTVVPHPAIDFCKAVFDSGVSLLRMAGSTDANARSFLGRLRQQLGDPEILTLIRQCEAEGISDPKAWLTAAAEKRNVESRRSSRGAETNRTRNATQRVAERLGITSGGHPGATGSPAPRLDAGGASGMPVPLLSSGNG
jgi:hypothetical protein